MRMTVRTYLAIGSLGVCAIAAPSHGQDKAAAPKPAPSEVVTWTLDNGLSVAYVHRPAAPVASVQMWYRAGTRDEPNDRRGVARLFEYLMFMGSDRVRTGDHRNFIESTGGYVDAFVIEDAAAFNNTVPSQHLDRVLELEADRMRGLLFRDDAIAAAKAELTDAIRRSHGSPFFRALVELMDESFSKHPYRRTSAGEVSDVEGLTAADIKSFYDGYYVPSNALLVIAGAVEADAARSAVDRHFAAIPAGTVPSRPSQVKEPGQTKTRRRQADGQAPIGFVVVGYHIPEAKHEDIYALQVLSIILARGESARLKKRFEKDESVRGSSAEALVREHPGLFVAYAASAPGADAQAIEKALVSELAVVTTKAPGAKEVARAKKQLSSGLAVGLDQLTGMARQIGQSWVLTGDPTHFLADIAAFDAVTPQAILAASKRYFTEKNRTVVIVRPAGGR